MKSIGLLLLLFSSVICLQAQEVEIAAPDSIFWADRIPESMQQQAMADTIQPAAADTIHPGVVVEGALLRSWQRVYPWQEVSYVQQIAAAEQLELEGCRELDSLLAVVDSIPFNASWTLAQNNLRLPVFYDAGNYEFQSGSLISQLSADSRVGFLPASKNIFQQQLDYGKLQKNAVDRYASSHLSQIRYTKGDAESQDVFERKRIERKAFETTELVISDAALDLETATLDIEQVTFHTDKWHRMGNTSVQVSQTALSGNWYKGGDNNMTMSTYDKLVFSRYDESMKTTLDITFELRLSGYYTAADTVNPVRVNDNQFRVDVSYGYKAWKNWYYSTSFYAKTPLLDYHTANSKVTKSTFFSPLETNLGVGLDYKRQSSDKRINFNLMLAPLSFSTTSVASNRVAVKQYGLEEGDHSKHQFGSSVTCKADWKITDMISWNTRFYYFTTYKAVKLEFENTFNFQIGKYCSAKFYYYPRLDDELDDHFECKQMLTFGLSFVW